jgi:tetratricopeptide (TPR) repeat protein
MSFKSTFLCIICLCPTLLFGQLTDGQVLKLIQTGSESKLVIENSRMIQDGYLYQAEMIADKLISLNPTSPNYNYRKGFLALKVRNDVNQAIPFLEAASSKTDVNYDMYGLNEKSAPIDALFHLAECYHLNENITKAKEFYQQFISTSRPQSELIKVAKLRLVQLDQLELLKQVPVKIELTNMGNNFNSQYAEFSPVVSLDGSAIFFTSQRPWENGETELMRNPATNAYPEDVYVSYLSNDSTWNSPKRLEFCEAQRNEATMAVSADERKIYLYEDITGSGDIYYTDFYLNKFNSITLLENSNINSEFWETHFMVSQDGTLAFFSSDRPGGFGGRDLYMCKKGTDGTWGMPVNLGPKINTESDEDAPFLSINNKQLYFASNGEKSIGGFDILVASASENGTWSEPTNVGYPFNSTYDDIYYTTTVDGLRGYVTSFRPGGNGEKDIYEIKNDFLGVKNIAVFKGVIKTTDGSSLPEDFAMNFKLSCDECSDSEKSKLLFPRLRDGMFMTGIQPCKTYRIVYFNATDNQTMYEEVFTTKCDGAYQEIYRDLLLDIPTRTISIQKDTINEIDTVTVIAYKNVEFMHYFDYNKNKLSTAKGDLKSFVKDVEKQLSEGRKSITINVYSSASRVPTKDYESNEKLASIRAENMKYDLQNYFDANATFNGLVKVVIVTSIVDGPEYTNDARNKAKYKPYQFVGLKTE